MSIFVRSHIDFSNSFAAATFEGSCCRSGFKPSFCWEFEDDRDTIDGRLPRFNYGAAIQGTSVSGTKFLRECSFVVAIPTQIESCVKCWPCHWSSSWAEHCPVIPEQRHHSSQPQPDQQSQASRANCFRFIGELVSCWDVNKVKCVGVVSQTGITQVVRLFSTFGFSRFFSSLHVCVVKLWKYSKLWNLWKINEHWCFSLLSYMYSPCMGLHRSFRSLTSRAQLIAWRCLSDWSWLGSWLLFCLEIWSRRDWHCIAVYLRTALVKVGLIKVTRDNLFTPCECLWLSIMFYVNGSVFRVPTFFRVRFVKLWPVHVQHVVSSVGSTNSVLSVQRQNDALYLVNRHFLWLIS